MNEYILVSTEDSVRVVRLNRPELGNALVDTMLNDLAAAVTEAENDPNVRAVVLTGNGRSFSTGGDLAYLAPFADLGAAEVAKRVYSIFSRAVRTVLSCTKPTVAAINGPAMGAGCDLALACDIRIAAPTARLSESWVNLGTLPALGGMYLLPRIVGLGRATEMIMTGRAVEADEAQRIGLVTEIVKDNVVGRAIDVASRLARQPAPTLALIKRGLARAADGALAAELEWASVAQSTLISSPIFREGVASILEKRAPDFLRAELAPR